MNTQVISIDTIAIKQDQEGRYCLNDLHKAAGDEHRHELLNWKNSDTFIGLVAASSNTGNPVVSKAGRYGGTFVVRELVYAYVMWTSPSFHLKVIRACDKLATQGVAVQENAATAFQQFAYVLLECSQTKKATEEGHHVPVDLERERAYPAILRQKQHSGSKAVNIRTAGRLPF